MAFILALASAVLYGAGDFTGGLSTRRAGALPVIVLSQAGGMVLLLLLMPLLPPSSPSRADLLWGVAGGFTGGAGVALLYYGLAIGRMAVVAPTTAVCAVVIPVLASVALGERPGPLAVVGILLGLGAIVLVGQQSDTDGAHDRRGRRGVGIALVAGVAIGLFLLVLAQTGPEAGMWPILVSRFTSVSLFLLIAGVRRQSLRLPGVLGLTLLCGVLDMSANALYLLAARIGPLSTVVALSSLYPASTVLLARLWLGERLNLRQLAGVGCALAAIVLIVSG